MTDFSPELEFLITDGTGGFFCATKSLRIDRKWHGWFTTDHSPRNRHRLLSGFEIIGYQNGSRIFNTSLWNDTAWIKSSHPCRVGLCSPSQNFLCFEDLNLKIYFKLTPGALGISIRGAAQFDQIILKPIFPIEFIPATLSDHRTLLQSVPKSRQDKQATKEISFWSNIHFDWKDEHEKGTHLLEWEKECEETWEEDFFTSGVLAFQPDEDFSIVIGHEKSNDSVPFQQALPDLELNELITRRELLDAAAEQFIVKTPEGRWTIMAGYPWFTDWGRDTMIALPGLCLKTGREEIAFDIIDHFLSYMNRGLIPNIFPEGAEKPRYNTIDGTLWLFDAIHRYTNIADLSGTKIPAEWNRKLSEIIEAHFEGTHENIKVDMDGLLKGGTEGSQLTWMDVKVNGHVPTPRHGKPVEIQALWYHALTTLNQHWSNVEDMHIQYNLDVATGQCLESFMERFIDPEKMLLADVVDRDGKGTVDWAQRPNQVIPFALENNPIPDSLRGPILRRVAKELLTPRGLRSLSPDDPTYKKIYRGPVEIRDRAYHQGTVWMWLLIPYARGVSEHRHLVPELFEQLLELCEDLLENHFLHEGCYAQANEIFDGNAPHTPRGCFAQAWSIAALIELNEILESG